MTAVEPDDPVLDTAPVAPQRGRRPAIRLSRWRPDAFGLAVIVASIWGAVANLSRLTFPGQAFDEPLYALAGWRYLHGGAGPVPPGQLSNIDNFEHPPLAKYLFGLAELIAGHPSVVADRVVAASCTLATAVVLGLWIGHVAGRWVGLGAALLVAVLPMSVPVANVVFRFGRYGFLDPVAELFAVSSVALAWMWFHRAGRAGWWFALATGAATGLAAAAKENGFLGVVGPIIAGLALVLWKRRDMVVRLLQTAVAVLAAGLVFFVSYLPVANPFTATAFLLRSQRQHSTIGHAVSFAGRTSNHPPAWAYLWFVQHGIGKTTAVAAVICVVAAIVLRRDRLVLWCVAALVAPLIFHMAIADVMLGFYWVAWMPALLALVALGLAELYRLSTSASRLLRLGGAILAGACVLVLAVASLHDTYRMLTRTAHDTSYFAAVRSRSPQVYLRLDELSGTRARDLSGNNHSASYAGSPRLGAPGLLSGDRDHAVVFHGADQVARVSGGAWLKTPDYTVSLWFQSTSAGRYLVARDDYVTKVWNLNLGPSGQVDFVTYSTFGGHGQIVTSAKSYDDGKPHMAVGVKHDNTMLLYVDGGLVGSGSWATFQMSATQAIDLGQRGNHAGPVIGTLDEFAWFGTSLSAADVRALYDAGTANAAHS